MRKIAACGLGRELLKEPLVCDRDLLVDFKPEPQIKPVPPGKCLIDATKVDWPKLDPRGVSGCGICLENVEDRNGLRVPKVLLLGIQTGWYKQNGWLRGVRIGEWLNLVKSKYPKLRNFI